MAAGTFMVRGHKVRTASQRRYVVFGCQRPERPSLSGVTLSVAKPWIVRRSDSRETAKRVAGRYGGRLTFAVTIDTTTGEEV